MIAIAILTESGRGFNVSRETSGVKTHLLFFYYRMFHVEHFIRLYLSETKFRKFQNKMFNVEHSIRLYLSKTKFRKFQNRIFHVEHSIRLYLSKLNKKNLKLIVSRGTILLYNKQRDAFLRLLVIKHCL